MHTRRSKPDKFGSSIQPCPFIRSNMKYRGSRRYVREKNGGCNVPEMSSGDIACIHDIVNAYCAIARRVKRKTWWKRIEPPFGTAV